MIPCVVGDIFYALLNPHFVLIQFLLLAIKNGELGFQHRNAIWSVHGCTR